MFKCKNCGSNETSKKPQQFKNGGIHIRESCEKCGSFIKWHKQEYKSFKNRTFELVQALASCNSQDEFFILKSQAQQFMIEAAGETKINQEITQMVLTSEEA